MSSAEIFERMTAEKDNFIAQLGGLLLTVDGVAHEPQFPDLDGWMEVEATPGLFMRAFQVPGRPESDFFHTRGEMGVHSTNAEIPQACRFTVLEGAVIWRQQWANGGESWRLGPGMTAYLKPHERHSYTFLEDCFNSVVITPPLSHHAPRPQL